MNKYNYYIFGLIGLILLNIACGNSDKISNRIYNGSFLPSQIINDEYVLRQYIIYKNEEIFVDSK